jgi:lipoprotein NlpI
VRSPNRAEIFRSELIERFSLPAFDGDAELDTRQQWNGLGAEVMRLTAARLDTARLRQLLVQNMERRYPGVTMIGEPELVDEVDRNRISVHARFKVPKLATAVDGNWSMRYLPANMQGQIAVPPSMTRRFPLALPGFPNSVVYSAEVQWPANVSVLPQPSTQRTANAQFVAETSRDFQGNVSRSALSFQTLMPSVPAADVKAFFDDAKKIERELGSTMTVKADQIKGGGFLGIGRKTLQETLQARAQGTVDRTSKSIASGQLGGDDLAQALCLRADAQTQLGHADLALKDADEATRQAPSQPAAWFCRGNANWSSGDFAAADADFGKSLALGQNPADAYSRRGHARFFAGRFEQAAGDFARAAAAHPDASGKVFPLLWQAWSLQRLGRPLPDDLKKLAAADSQGAWPLPALALATGLITPDQLLALIDRKQGDDREAALAEGLFAIGEYWLTQADVEKARDAFAKSRAQGITPYVEYGAAGFELQRLAAKP